MPDRTLEIADKARPAFRRAIIEATEKVRAGINVRALSEAIDTGRGLDAISFEPGVAHLKRVLPALYRDLLEQSADAYGDWLKIEKASRRFGAARRLDVTDPYVTEWIRRRSGAMIQDWGTSNREALRAILETGMRQNMSTSQLARWIRNSGIGLDERWAIAAQRYRERLLREGMDPARVEALSRRYAERLLRLRAERIAKTESVMAATQGQLAYLRQLIASGQLSPEAELEWVTDFDERTCPLCSALDGERKRVGELFEGGVDGPPRHPSCRCALKLVAPGY